MEAQPRMKNIKRLGTIFFWSWALDWKIVHQWLRNSFAISSGRRGKNCFGNFPLSEISKTLQVIFHESFDWNKSKTICHISRFENEEKFSNGFRRAQKFFMVFARHREAKKYHKFSAFFNVKVSFLQECQWHRLRRREELKHKLLSQLVPTRKLVWNNNLSFRPPFRPPSRCENFLAFFGL